ncbi:MAG: hypothetical protein IPN62_17210 [Flavobacteriales bacterium]|nr:hypothetical protein [Flavobacteriales bacterium]
MPEKIFLKVSVNDKELLSVRSVNVVQTIFGHHTFEVVVPSASIEAKADQLFDKLPNLIGETILIDWETSLSKEKSQGTDRSAFKGIVMDVSVSGQQKDHLLVTLTGKSPTILMDSAPNSDTYAKVGLKELYDKANSGNLTEKLRAEDHLTFKGKLPFVVQYNETDFDFICRIMHEHGEWFYYDGQKIRLGISDAPPLNLGPQRVQSLDFTFSTTPPSPTLSAWDYLANKKVEIQGAKPSHPDGISSKVLKRSNELYPAGADKSVNQPFPSYAEGEDDQPDRAGIKSLMDRVRQGHANDTHRIMGSSDLAEMQVGATVKLDGFAYSGEYIVTQVTHSCRGRDNYQNYFQAVPSGASVPASLRMTAPHIESSRAKVVDNKDPKKLGRVRVEFEWGEARSPWLRTVWPHAGKDRGFYFVPEVDDEVIVGFEMGRARAPYVIGSLYNGENGQPGQFNDKNELKIIRTRSGNEVIFDDTGIITIRNNKNKIELNCKSDGTLTIQTDGELVLKAGKDIQLEAGGAVKMVSGKEFSIKSGKDLKVAANANVELKAMANATLKATGNASVEATGQLVLKGTTSELSASAMTQVKGALVKIN